MSKTAERAIIDHAISEDCGVWFESGCAKIWDKDRKLISPTQNHLQRLIRRVLGRMEEMGLPLRVIGLKPRQKGSTTYFGAEDYHWMRRHAASVCVIGGQYSQTNSLWSILQTYNDNDSFNWGNSGKIHDSFGEWTNGSRLTSETAGDKLAGISSTFQVLHATEVARWSSYGVANAPTVLANILKCVPLIPNSVVFLESSAEGASGSFHERWIEATDAEDFLSGAKEIMPGDYVRVFSPWFEFGDSAMRLTEPQKEVIRSTLDSDPDFDGEKMLLSRYGRIDESGVQRLGESVTEHDAWEQLAWRRYAIAKECGKDRLIFDRDYPHSWQDAFMKSGNMRFSRSGLSILRDRMHERVPLYGTLQEAQGRPVFHQTDPLEAKVILFERPMPMRRYILSVDPMTGAMQASGKDPDFHGVFVMQGGFQDGTGKWNPPAAVARVVPCRWDIDVLEETIWRLARHYGDSSGCKIVVEMNQDRGLTELLKQRGADLYMREVFNQTEFKTTKAYGYLTMEKSRERAIECLAAAIRDWDEPGGGVRIWDETALRECENFIRKANGRSEAAEGHKDDSVFSLALGLLLIEHATIFNPNAGMSYIPPDLLPIIGGAQGLPGQFS